MKISKKLIIIALAISLLGITGCGGYFPWASHRRAVNHYVTAISLESAEFDEDAIFQLRQAVELDPDFALAHSKLGSLYQQAGQHKKAANAFENACKLDPWSFDDHLSLGNVYKILKRFTEAVKTLRRACQLQPDSTTANYSLGLCYYETKQYEQAKRYCLRAAELTPDDLQIVATLGDIYGKTGDDYHAINSYKQALEANPQDTTLMVKLGTVYVRMKRFSPARHILIKAVEKTPQNADTHIALAYCLLSERKLQDALDSYKRAHRLDPKNYKALNGIGVTYMFMFIENKEDRQMARDAIEAWHQSLELNPNQPKITKLIQKYSVNN